jgi:transcriptional regulator with XRE-family HTH domain
MNSLDIDMEHSEIIEKIKDLRFKKGYSLGQLSKLTGLSKGYLSKIENAVSVPPISTLHRIATALGVDLVYIFSQNHLDQINNKIVVGRKNARKETGTGFQESGLKFWPLADQKFGRNMDPYIFELPYDHDWIFQFEGEEFNLILEGKVELRYGDERYILEEGDSVYIDGDIPYSGKSIGDKTAKILTITYRYKKVAGEPFSDGILPNKFQFHRSSNR